MENNQKPFQLHNNPTRSSMSSELQPSCTMQRALTVSGQHGDFSTNRIHMHQETEKYVDTMVVTQHVNVDKTQRPSNTCCNALFLHSPAPWMTFKSSMILQRTAWRNGPNRMIIKNVDLRKAINRIHVHSFFIQVWIIMQLSDYTQ